MESKTRVIIPCAGYGTRMGMKPNESKEMLIHNGFPIIDYALDLCKECDCEPVLIIRPEKTDLIRHLDLNHGRVRRHIYTPTGEFPQTMLDSKEHWGLNNILLLPDTRFTPAQKTIYEMSHDFYKSDLIFALHHVTDPSNWGVIRRNPKTREIDSICEKPSDITGSHEAWGLIGFNKYVGVDLFTKMLTKDVFHPIKNTAWIRLSSFEDITRG